VSRPWMPLYVGDYLADTRRLSTLEHGAYLLLIMDYWQNGSIPDDDGALARIAGLTPKEWAKVKPAVLRLFEAKRWFDGLTPASAACGIGRVDRREAVPKHIRDHVWARDGRSCFYCESTDTEFDLDHKFPWSRGGKNTVENLVVACARCNRSKGARTVEEWLN
jgi:hypothetical protein